MSLVGTRPPTVDEWEQYELHHRSRMSTNLSRSLIMLIVNYIEVELDVAVIYLVTQNFRHVAVSFNDAVNLAIGCEADNLYETDINEFKTKRAEIERQNPAAAQVIDTYIEHPELKIASDYHFSELENLSGELYIMGLSPQNDSHIFSCIEKSSVEKVIFYFYGEPPRKLPLTKPYEFKDIKKLWKSLDANIPQYNCGRKYPNSDQAKKVFDVLNVFSLDPITKEEMEKEANAIPDFIVKPLYREAMDLMETFGTPKDEEELLKQARMVSRIALREGIFPSVLYLFIITVKEK